MNAVPPDGAARSEADADVRRLLTQWSERAFDLSKRNRLLNAKPGRYCLMGLNEDASAVEDRLAGGAKLRLMGTDEHGIPVNAGRSQALHLALPEDDVSPSAVHVYRRAKTLREESGLQTTFLGLGAVEWSDAANGEDAVKRLAPALLQPVQVTRDHAKGQYWIESAGTAAPNTTLMEWLRREHGVAVNLEDPLPEDEHGVDVVRALDSFRTAVGECRSVDFQVLDGTMLGVFDFQRQAIAADLASLAEAGLNRLNAITRELIGHESEAGFGGSGADCSATAVEDRLARSDLPCPIETDAAQLEAVAMAQDGRSFVMQGPPGTGKSQTIANIIATQIAAGKTVLFAAEKRAAIEAVSERLAKVGLMDWCMDIHGHGAAGAKASPAKALGLALEREEGRSARIGNTRVAAAAGIDERRSLNAYVKAMHDERLHGVSLRVAMERSGTPADRMQVTLPETSGDDCDSVESRLDAMKSAVLESAGIPADLLPITKQFETLDSSDLDAARALAREVVELRHHAEAASAKVAATRMPDFMRSWPAVDDARLKLAHVSRPDYMEPNAKVAEAERELREIDESNVVIRLLFRPGAIRRERKARALHAEAKRTALEEAEKAVLRAEAEHDFAKEAAIGEAERELREAESKLREAIGEACLKAKCPENALTDMLDERTWAAIRTHVEVASRTAAHALWWPSTEVDVAAQAVRLGSSDEPLRSLCERYERGWWAAWASRWLSSDPVLRTWNRHKHESQAREFVASEDAWLEAANGAASEVAERCRARLTLPDRGSRDRDGKALRDEAKELEREARKSRRHKPLRRMLEDAPTLSRQLKPCIMLSPLDVAKALPRDMTFDLALMDEASQIKPEDALGVVARVRQVVLAGDQKQMPPTAFFEKGSSEDDDEDADLSGVESVLDVALARRMPLHQLTFHYRSRHEELIAFSNRRYYDGKLVTFPSPARDAKAVSLMRPAEPIYEAGRNAIEAKMVADYVVDHCTGPNGSKESIGVICFNQAQQRLVEDLLDTARIADPDLDASWHDESRPPPCVKNLETAQGDERDVIVLSTTFGPDPLGRQRSQFGPLNRDGGERRLNVAVTRAKTRMVVATSLDPTKIGSPASPRGVKDLRQYIEYAARGGREDTTTHAEATIGDSVGGYDSPLEEQIAAALEARGWHCVPQVGVAGFRIDIGVTHPDDPGRYLAGIEADGAQYHSSKTARDRDRLRHRVLESKGWRLLRVWSPDWWRDADGVMERMDAALKALATGAPVKLTGRDV